MLMSTPLICKFVHFVILYNCVALWLSINH